jgi:WD40 repeat protein
MGLMPRRMLLVLVGVLVSVVLGVAPAGAFFTHVFASSFGSQGSEAGQVSLAPDSGVAVNFSTHDVYVADTENARVDQFSAGGEFIRAWGWGVADGLPEFETCTLVCQAGIKGSAPGEFELPTFVAVDNSGGPSQGDVYVGDTGNRNPAINSHGTNLVQKFTASGVLVAGWGVGGQLDGSTSSSPAGPFKDDLGGIAVDQGGNLFVHDLALDLFKFAQDGTPATGIHTGLEAPPFGIGVDSGGDFYVGTQNLIDKLSPTGALIGAVNASHNSNAYGFTRGVVVDPATGDIYIDTESGSFVEHYAASCDPSVGCNSVDSFGSGVLSGAAGLAVDSPAGIVYVADAGNGRIEAFGPPPALPPSIGSPSIAAVASTSAEMRTAVNPNLYDTHFHFQYVADAAFQASGFANAAVVPASDVDLGDGSAELTASAHPQDLLPSTAYHFRIVADNGNGGPQVGPVGVFTTQPAGGAFQLPDGRAYEQVTPTVKGDGYLATSSQVYSLDARQASVSGDGFAYTTLQGFPGSQAGVYTSYLASRGAGGWVSQDLTPPQATNRTLLGTPLMVGYSADLSKAALRNGGGFVESGQDSPALVSGEPANNVNLFLRDNTDSFYQLMNITPQGVTPRAAVFAGASADFSHVLFASTAQLTPEAVNGGGNLYQWAGGSVSLVDQIPTPPATRCGGGGPPCSVSPVDTELGDGRRSVGGFLNAVSPDGSKVFFTTGRNSQLHQLFVRENGTTTVEISASQKNNGSGPAGTDPNGPLDAVYWPASSDGSKAFFTSCEQLTNDSTAASEDHISTRECLGGEDLYRYDTASGVLVDLTVDHAPGDVRGADVQGVVGSSADGSYVYFVANGVLAGGASPGDCELVYTSPGETCNLYLSHGGVTTFIAALDGGDLADWRPESPNGEAFSGRVTPDGSRVAFQSVRSLTGYDNTVASGSHCGTGLGYGVEPFGVLCPEVFLYDAGVGRLSCASCNPSGARPVGPSTLDGTVAAGFRYLPRNLAADGRLFFDSGDALVPGDVNGKRDVYEYENGRASLISSGTSGSDSFFLDASPSGNDVFFNTRSQLVPQDKDEKLDVYDARVGGGFPAPVVPPPPCLGESCKAPPVGLPGDQAPGSAGVAGAGNLLPSPAGVGVRSRPPTRVQKLAAALRVCQRKRGRRRASCVARARRLYGPVKAGKATRRSVRGAK